MHELNSAWELTRVAEVSGATQHPTGWRKVALWLHSIDSVLFKAFLWQLRALRKD